MLEIALANMPFGTVSLPSLGLTQLRSVLGQQFGDRVAPRIFYLNHDFAQFLGLEPYQLIANSMDALISGLGDWFFRSVAYPDLDEQVDLYRRRYLTDPMRQQAMRQYSLWERRQETGSFLDQLIARYRLAEYPVVGFSSLFQQNIASFALARKIKERNPEVVTVMGGANCETSMGAAIVRNVESIDFVFSGPALATFPEFVRRMLDGDEDGRHRIRGVLSKRNLEEKSGTVVNEIGADVDIDQPLPLDYGDYLATIDEKFPPGAVVPALLFESSRGCWWGQRSQCTFCGLNGLEIGYRGMQADNALQQFERLFEYAPRVKRFEAVDNIMPREYVTEVLPHVKPPPDVTIFYEVRADLKDHELAVLAKAGVKEIQPGIEALATSTLKLMKKGTTVFQNLTFLKNCVRHNIQPAWNLLVGFPGEGEDVYAKYVEDLPHLTHLMPPSGVFPVRFDRFSIYFNSPEEYGLKLRPMDFYKLIYPFEKESLDDLAYYFADLNYAAPYLAAMVKWIDRLRQQVTHWQTRWQPSDNQIKPELYLKSKNHTGVVYDSRSGKVVEQEVSALGLRALETLARAMKLPRLQKALGDPPQAEIQSELASLQERGLVFHEGEMYLSLVL